MDPRRLLTLALASFSLSGCAILKEFRAESAVKPAAATPGLTMLVPGPPPPARLAIMAPIPNPPAARAAYRPALARGPPRSRAAPPPTPPGAGAPYRPALPRQAIARRPPAASGRTAIAAANVRARETSTSNGFVGGVQVFSYDPGRVYEVWTAPLRVTTLTLAPGETIVSKAAGDTVRWQIGETTSGQGPGSRSHVMIKPLARGLETNLVLATSQRVYLIQLRSGPPETFNAAVTWDLAAVAPAAADAFSDVAETGAGLVTPTGPLDARFKISARGRKPA
ncbi:MAG TPA: TrbG/VirB9 family P-type conjugative transfer protein, partial [Phenylobacterium sp.]|nr:TrbG/VirB9 family P-type conjugative transfer protein [Phenylobacterium sp.]